MLLLRHVSRQRRDVCRPCIRGVFTNARGTREETRWSGEWDDAAARKAAWAAKAGTIRSGAQQSMLSVLEERGFVKDIAGGREALDWLLTEKRIGVYVGVDPTAPSLHVGHLVPLMALYWMYIHGYYTVSLLGAGTVQVGDPSGRTTGRTRQKARTRNMNVQSMKAQLDKLWTHVKCLGIKHQFPQETSRKLDILDNSLWLDKLSAVELMRDLGSNMRLGAMLARDSVKVRMESGEGMAISEFSYPLFQAWDWWHMYKNKGVQLQIGGSDQYGNICAGMDSVSHMQKMYTSFGRPDDTKMATYGLTTPLLTTASGEKFGKSAGNAVWLDPHMMSSFDLYQYFLKTADDDVERYLKLFTFLSLDEISLLMGEQRQNESKRVAQHILAREIVELAHGAAEAKNAETAHKEAFSHGTNTFSLGALRSSMNSMGANPTSRTLGAREKEMLAYKKSYATPSAAQSPSGSEQPQSNHDDKVTLPMSLLKAGSFPRVLHAAGLASSKSDAHRLIAKGGAYVVVPNSGSSDNATALQWIKIEAEAIPTADPSHFLVDWEVLVLRSGKSNIRTCRIVTEEQFKAEGLSCPGWEELRDKPIDADKPGSDDETVH